MAHEVTQLGRQDPPGASLPTPRLPELTGLQPHAPALCPPDLPAAARRSHSQTRVSEQLLQKPPGAPAPGPPDALERWTRTRPELTLLAGAPRGPEHVPGAAAAMATCTREDPAPRPFRSRGLEPSRTRGPVARRGAPWARVRTGVARAAPEYRKEAARPAPDVPVPPRPAAAARLSPL